MICLCGHRAAPGRAEPRSREPPASRRATRLQLQPARCQEPVHVVRRPYAGSAGSWSSPHRRQRQRTAGSRGGAEAAAIGEEKSRSHRPQATAHRAILRPRFLFGHFGVGAILYSFAPQPGAQQRSDGQPRPQRNPHTPGATHACACAAPYRALYSRVPPTANTEKVTHACAPRSEALTHARSPSASQLPAARASPRASAAPPSWLRSAPQPLPSPLSLPALARPRRVRLRPRRCT